MLQNDSIRSVLASVIFLAMLAGTSHGQTLKKDEDVIVFPSYAYEGRDGMVHLSFHAWFFELESDSMWRKVLVNALKKLLPPVQTPEEQKILQGRLHGFTVDNERNKSLAFKLGTRSIDPGLSGSDGHLQSEWDLTLPAKERADLESGNLPLTWERGGMQKPLWVSRHGLSVVSDIDDTIKITQVLDRKAMVANSFVRAFQPVGGMPELYKRLARSGAVFHYVSASPWQLYPDLNEFVQRHFPGGTMSLRKLRWKDSSGVEFLWHDSLAYKTKTIAETMQRFPQRKFLLIGDSGERDPEVYAEIRRRFPAQIVGILIRIPPEQKSPVRKEGMEYFHEPAEVESALKRWGY